MGKIIQQKNLGGGEKKSNLSKNILPCVQEYLYNVIQRTNVQEYLYNVIQRPNVQEYTYNVWNEDILFQKTWRLQSHAR